jgi:hypothetical protein
MQADALKFIADQAAKANPGARIVYTDREPDHIYYVLQADGDLKRVAAEPEPENHRADDIPTLAALAKESMECEPCAQIWYGRHGAVLINPGLCSRARVRLKLAPSPQMMQLISWDQRGKGSVGQAELVLLLRTLFAGCAPEGLLSTIRGVRTQRAAEVNSQITQGKVSLGKSLVAEMSGTAAIPEEVSFKVPVFDSHAVRVFAQVRLAIDPDPQTESFTLVVLPGQIEAAHEYAESWFAEMIRAELGPENLIPLYRGQP